jgi:hypothetical protein
MRFLLILLLFSQCVSAQDNVLRKDVDKATGENVYTSGLLVVDGGYKERLFIEVSLGKSKYPNFFIQVTTELPNCISEEARVVFLYDNGAQDTLISNHKPNCEGFLNFRMDGEVNKMDNLSQSPISQIKFETKRGPVEITLEKSEAVFITRKRLPKVFAEIKFINPQ